MLHLTPPYSTLVFQTWGMLGKCRNQGCAGAAAEVPQGVQVPAAGTQLQDSKVSSKGSQLNEAMLPKEHPTAVQKVREDCRPRHRSLRIDVALCPLCLCTPACPRVVVWGKWMKVGAWERHCMDRTDRTDTPCWDQRAISERPDALTSSPCHLPAKKKKEQIGTCKPYKPSSFDMHDGPDGVGTCCFMCTKNTGSRIHIALGGMLFLAP